MTREHVIPSLINGMGVGIGIVAVIMGASVYENLRYWWRNRKWRRHD